MNDNKATTDNNNPNSNNISVYNLPTASTIMNSSSMSSSVVMVNGGGSGNGGGTSSPPESSSIRSRAASSARASATAHRIVSERAQQHQPNFEGKAAQQVPRPHRPKPLNKFWRTVSWYSIPRTPWEHLIPVDLTALWRRHTVWSKKDGADLLEIVTARYVSTTVFLSLLVSAELGVLFSPSSIVEVVRQAVKNNERTTLQFWTGIVLCVSILLSVCALVANFTAWSIFRVLSQENAPVILRSSIGLYTAQLPSRMVIACIYLFFASIVMFWWTLLPLDFAILLTVGAAFLLSNIATTYSAMGRVIMATSAMGRERILTAEEEEELLPKELYQVLLHETQIAHKAKVPVNRQYRATTTTTDNCYQYQNQQNYYHGGDCVWTDDDLEGQQQQQQPQQRQLRQQQRMEQNEISTREIRDGTGATLQFNT